MRDSKSNTKSSIQTFETIRLQRTENFNSSISQAATKNDLKMTEIPPTSDYAIWLLIGGVITTLLVVSIVIFRALTLNTNELLLKITAVALAGATLFFYCVIWLGVTLLSPTGNHTASILICYLFTGILPAVYLYTRIDAPNEQNITKIEEKYDNET